MESTIDIRDQTTFASLIGSIEFGVILEDFQNNPFLSMWYSDPKKYVFETEISFILQHYHQIKRDQVENRINICDFSFYLDLAFAEMGLKGSQLNAFITVLGEIKQDLIAPALLVHLVCDPEVELQRIRHRNRGIEKSITADFLDELNKAIEKQVAIARETVQVIKIDSTNRNFAEDELVRKNLADQFAHIFRS